MIQNISKTCIEWQTKYKYMKPYEKSIWIRNKIQAFGPSYVKIGQFVSSRSDIIGKNKVLKDALSMLRDNVEPTPWRELEKLIDTSNFKEIDPVPLASASIGQVHKTITMEGEEVAIKFRKPNVIEKINADVMIYINILQIVKKLNLGDKDAINDFIQILNNLKNSIVNECNLNKEVENLQKFKSLKLPKVKIPQVYPYLCTDDVIVMEYVPHIKLTEAYTDKIKNKKLASEIMGLFINQFIFNGVVHADPHLGNLALLPDRSRFVMYDFGHVIEFDVKTRNYMKLFVFELMNENIDNIITIIKKVPELITIIDEDQLIKYIKEYVKYIKTIDITVLKDLTQNDKSNLPFKFSGKIYELIRTFGIIEGICIEIDPTFSYNEVFNKYIDMFFNDGDFLVMKSSIDMDNIIDMF